MSTNTGKKKGTVKSRQNSDKECLYLRAMDEAEKLDFQVASGIDGIDDEIALLRVKIKSILGDDPQNIKLLIDVTNAIERLVRTRYKITKEQRKGLKEAIGNVLKDIALPLGIGLGAVMEKHID
jgi:hypothetical protein